MIEPKLKAKLNAAVGSYFDLVWSRQHGVLSDGAKANT